MAVNTRVSNATQNFLMPQLVEGVLTGNVGVSYFLARSKAGVWKGAQVEVPFKYATNPNGGSFSGFDILATAAVDNTIKLTADCKFNYQDVSLASTDLALNDTEKQVANLMKRQTASDTMDLADKIGTQFYADGTGNSSKEITGLAAIVDDGTTVANFQGQSRSTYTTLKATVTASSGTLSLAKMYTLWDTVTEGNQQPDLLLTTKTVYSLYNQLLEPKERYNFMDMGPKEKIYLGEGAKALFFRGAPIISDSKCTSGVLFMLNSKSFEFQVLETDKFGSAINYAIQEMDGEPSPDVPKGLGFYWGGWKQPVNQLVMSGKVVHAGNFVATNPRYNGKLTGITQI